MCLTRYLFSNRMDSGTLIPFLNHIQRMQGKSYRDIVADAGGELRNKCFKSYDEAKNKEIWMCVESAEHRKTAFENLLSERGARLRMNRSIQVEGAFGVLKSDRNFRRFLMRGKTNISTEPFLLCLAFDLQKFFSKLQCEKRKSHLFSLKKSVEFFGTKNVKS